VGRQVGRVAETWWTSEGGFCARRHSFACAEAKLLSMECSKPGATPSVSPRISAPHLSRVGRGQPVGL
jgi:hypothetical protein